MEAETVKDGATIGCEVIFEADAKPSSLRRFLVGLDREGPQEMDATEVEQELNDAFAILLLREGVFPETAEGVFKALDTKIGDDHPLAAGTQRSFVVAEGSQIAKDPSRSFSRNLRLLVTRGKGQDGPDLMVSAFSPDDVSIELMAWDDRQGGFNFYRTIPRTNAPGSWVWAGNSRHAWQPGTRSSGPFESHPTGNLLFKEFKLPWVNWHSPKTPIDRLDLERGDPLADHPWFAEKEGAYVLEGSVARPVIERWNRRRLGQIAEAATIEEPTQVLERLLGSPDLKHATVNLVSSETSQPALENASSVDLPASFFVDADGLISVLGLDGPPKFEVSAATYRDLLAEFEVKLQNHDEARPLNGEEEFVRPGDTHFLFVVPERAFEDTDFFRQLVKPNQELGETDLGLVSERLAGCLLMVDFSNPVFADRRASLLGHLPTGPLSSDVWSDFAQSLGDAIAAAADGTDATVAEGEFAALWNLGDGWKDAANDKLSAYYDAVSARLKTPDGLRDVFKLAEARRNKVREMPIDESPLLFAQTTIPAEEINGLAMRPDGSVEKRGGG